jgi:hypothetical protein
MVDVKGKVIDELMLRDCRCRVKVKDYPTRSDLTAVEVLSFCLLFRQEAGDNGLPYMDIKPRMKL